MGRRRPKEEGEHEVTITVNIAKASYVEYDPIVEKQHKKGQGKPYEPPKAQNYFHSTYKLLPDDKESVKTDVVTYGVAAKIYTDSDSRVLRTWTEKDKTWVAWTNSHKIKVTKDVLLKMFNHTLELKIWDSKDKVSPKARFDRPKAFKLPQPKPGEESDIEMMKKLVSELTENSQDGLTLPDVATRVLDANISKEVSSLEKKKKVHIAEPGQKESHKDKHALKKEDHYARATATPQSLRTPLKSIEENAPKKEPDSNATQQSDAHASSVKVKVFLKDNKEPEMGKLMLLASSGISTTAEDDDYDDVDADELLARQQASRVSTQNGKRSSASTKSSKSKAQSSAQKKAEALAAHIKHHGLASIPVKLSALFTGTKFISSRLESATGTVEDLVISLSLDAPLLSEPQKRVLNPLVIKVSNATNMPSKPLSYTQLQNRCLPAFISYKFHTQPLHKSKGRRHTKKITFDDIHVILLGIEDKETLFEFLQGPALVIEVHDRDRNLMLKKEAASVFGQSDYDRMICNASRITSRRTEYNAFTDRDSPWDPYGVAKFDLSELLLGEKILERTAPIQCCRIPDVIDGRGSGNNSDKIVGKPGSVDGPDDSPIPAANYLECESELKVKIELAFPLRTIEEIEAKKTIANPKECPFSRLIYIFDYDNTQFLKTLQSEVTSINAKSLQLNDLPKHVMEAALSTYKLNELEQKSKTLDIITGFQIIDGNYHIFVLEGLRDQGIKTLWDNLPCFSQDDGKCFVSIYNSQLTFQERLYASLDVDLTRVRLHQPLDAIVKQPLLYVRDMVPRDCMEGLLKLHELRKSTKLRDVIRNELFPSAEMIASLSKEFGIPLTSDDFEDSFVKEKMNQQVIHDDLSQSLTALKTKTYKTSRPWTPLEIVNPKYDEMLKTRETTFKPKNFLVENKSRVHQLEPIKREKTITCDPATLHNNEAHNYSIQSLNTTEKAKQKLRQHLSEEPDERFTYSQRFSTATVLPVDPDEIRRSHLFTSRKEWRTPQGFVLPGPKTSAEANKHAKEPDFARLDELKKPWRENILHANVLKPTVNRMEFSWDERSSDFDIWTKPKAFFGSSAPATIHLAGDTLAEERKKANDEEKDLWKKALVTDDLMFKVHRVGMNTELKSKGIKSSSQTARLENMLKSEPKKYSLSAPGLRLRRIPALSVVLNPTVDSSMNFYERLQFFDDDYEARERNCGYNPGPFDNKGWLLDKNKIPIRNYEHKHFDETNGGDFKDRKSDLGEIRSVTSFWRLRCELAQGGRMAGNEEAIDDLVALMFDDDEDDEIEMYDKEDKPTTDASSNAKSTNYDAIKDENALLKEKLRMLEMQLAGKSSGEEKKMQCKSNITSKDFMPTPKTKTNSNMISPRSEATREGKEKISTVALRNKQRVAHAGKYEPAMSRNSIDNISNRKSQTVTEVRKKAEVKVADKKEKKVDNRPSIVEEYSRIHIINPLISSQTMEARMEGRKFVKISSILGNLNKNLLNLDWVTVGVIVNKLPPKTASNGKTFSIWKLSDLDIGSENTTVTLFLFGNVYKEHWKTIEGTVIGLLNASIMAQRDNEQIGDVAITIDDPRKMMIIGTSKDLGRCKGGTKKGKQCSFVVNKTRGDFCEHHVSMEYKKIKSQRMEFQSGSGPDPKKGNLMKKFKKDVESGQYCYGGETLTWKDNIDPNKKPSSKKLTLQDIAGPGCAEYLKNAMEGIAHSDESRSTEAAESESDDKLLASEEFKKRLQIPTAGSRNLLHQMKLDKKEEKENSSTGKSDRRSAKDLLIEEKRQQRKQPVKEIDLQLPAFKVKPPSLSTRNFSADFRPKLARGFDPDDDIEFADFGNVLVSSGLSKAGGSSVEFHDNPLLGNSGYRPSGKSGVSSAKKSDIAKRKAIAIVRSKGIKFDEQDDDEEKHKSKTMQKINERVLKDISCEENLEPSSKKRRKGLLEDAFGSLDFDSDEAKRILKTKSAHVGQVRQAEAEREAAYFNVLEKKEMYEEKMQNVKEIKVEVACCKICKYMHEFASKYCKDQGHPIIKVDAMKRFFICKHCKHRTIAFKKLPDHPCRTAETQIEEDIMNKELKDEAGSLTIHGVARIFSSKTKRGRTFWLALSIMMTVVLVRLFILLVEKHLSRSVLDKVTLERATRQGFPAVTICNTNLYSYHGPVPVSQELPANCSMLDDKYFANKKNRDYFNIACSLFLANFTPVATRIRSVLDHETLRFPRNFSILPNLWPCFTFNRGGRISQVFGGEDSALTMVLYLDDKLYENNMLSYMDPITSGEQGLFVYIHDPAVHLPISTRVHLAPGFHTRIKVKKVTRHRLPKPFPSKCSDKPNADYSRIISGKQSNAQCYFLCFITQLYDACNGTLPHFRVFLSAKDFPKTASYESHSCSQNFELNTFDYRRCDCSVPCNEIQYKLEDSSTQWPQDWQALMFSPLLATAEGGGAMGGASYDPSKVFSIEEIRKKLVKVTIYYDEMLTEKHVEEEQYSFDMVVADLGGQMGLFLGGSILSLVEVFVLLGKILKSWKGEKNLVEKVNPSSNNIE
eukprot:gene5993-6689_t